jgi:branched-chain amino acid aminotransferase
VAQSPGANIFIEKDGKLYTPPVGNILPGITRKAIMSISSILEIDVQEKHFTAADLKAADGAFLCGTATEVIGIESVDDTVFEMPFQDTLGAILKRAYRSLVMDKNNYEVLI